MYEAYRLFRDRLVGTEAINRFDNILATVVRSDWSANVFDSIASKFFVCHVLTFVICWHFPESLVKLIQTSTKYPFQIQYNLEILIAKSESINVLIVLFDL